jgi:site-specific recombinase XerD
MEKQKQSIDSLENAMLDYLKNLHRCEGTIYRYSSKMVKLKNFMHSNNIKSYDIKVGKRYLKSILGDFDYNELTNKEKLLVRSIEALDEFQKTGRTPMGQRIEHPKEFNGNIGGVITDFIEYRRVTFNLSKKTVNMYNFFLYRFYCHLKNRMVSQIQSINVTDILSYVAEINPANPANRHAGLGLLRLFFKHLYDQYILTVDYSTIIPHDNYKQQPKLPSAYTDEEIQALLMSVDRGNPKGKRDYAILLLATKLGIRASDICGLRFENILWERNVLIFNQSKTSKTLELPLLSEIGNAIIDYLKHGRPISEESYCFLNARPPYDRIKPDLLGDMVRKYFTLSGINYLNKKHGSHSLRHCFASALLKEQVPLSVITEILGHTNGESTMYYLRIDTASLRKCALEIPPLPSSFYEQKGEYRHE